MRRAFIVEIAVAIVIGLASAGEAAAATLDCAAFKVRMDGALLATGLQDADALTFKVGFTDPVRGSRLSWSGSGLSGTMACGVADEFEEFGVSLAFTAKKDVAVGLKHFIAVGGASICALSSDTAPACGEMARGMVQESLEQMGKAFNHGSKTPAGTSERTVLPGVKADITSAPTLLTFLIGPDQGTAVDATRRPLTPQPAKPVE